MTETTPDPRLVDAAPDLLAALRLATEYIEQLSPAWHHIDADVRRMVLTKAHAALLAATGGEP
jgi:hypothetical protein